MRVKLLAPHIIPVSPGNDCWRAAGAVVELPPGYPLTPMMEGLDDEARMAVEHARLKVWGRYWWPYGLYPPGYMGMLPLDNPPIPRPLDDNQPVYHYTGRPEYL